ncbi:snapalysin [Streptomyces sp. A7024]|uniref:Extracellular small neutral protease n=1 Tax=Streptomyces coryli TaxID=1128680 RepID=A0A6G4UA31_9ACTN|nr:snapalysin [Streptomyces coryli]NGN68862.1 snapalysin [Streptomyces coryli]
MRVTRSALSAAAALGLAATALGTVSAAAADNTGAQGTPTYVTYEKSKESAKANKAFFEAVWKQVAKKRAANPGVQAVTITYSAASAPTFKAQIDRSTQIWNSSVQNVQLQEGSSADFTYREGNDPRGSYASTDGHGNGYIFLDYAQNQQYDSTRVTTHETGHVLGLPDNYSGPCSELMSGGGPGPSCTNAQPDANERARVEQLWANGFGAALDRFKDGLSKAA